MSMISYSYSISTSFPNHTAAPDRLGLEIQQSSIVTAYDHIDTADDTAYIWFKASLSSEDQATLDALVGFHSGEPLPATAQPVFIDAPTATSGVLGSAPARGLGGFVPDPSNNPQHPEIDEVVSHYADLEGSLVTRGKVFSDEGSFREDFTGASLVLPVTGDLTFTNGSKIVTGTGTIFPDEINRAYYVKLSADGEENWGLVSRVASATLVLDGPYTGTSATGAADRSRWVQRSIGSDPGSTSVSGSTLILSSGTGIDGGFSIERYSDYAPISVVFTLSVSQRVSNQTIFFGFRDDPADPKHYCDVQMTDTDDTKVTFVTAWDGDEQATTVSLPTGLHTSNSLRYKIDLSIEYCGLMVNGVALARHNNHLPDMYAEMQQCAGISNNGSVTNTDLEIDTVLFIDHNQIQIGSMFDSPVPFRVSEDQHTVLGKVVTNSTVNDQVVVSYSVPSGKVMYLIGYRVDNDGNIDASSVKIGRIPLGTEPISPGSLDGNIFRCFSLSAKSTTGEVDMGSNPRKLGIGGDVVQITVTPTAKTPTTWHAALDFVLR
jgi:hypothetical protein